MPIDERRFRKAGFDESGSVAVVMPCGDSFYLPRPMLFLEPVFHDGVLTKGMRLASDDPELEAIKESVRAAANAVEETGSDFEDAVVRLAVYLLRANYDLADADLGRIFRIPESGDYSADWMGEVMAVANGRAPKPSAVG